MSLDVLCKPASVTGGKDVHGQTRPNAEKQPGKPLSTTGIIHRLSEIACLTLSAAPGLIPTAYANQLTSGSATLQSP
jgi:hypothetical protein